MRVQKILIYLNFQANISFYNERCISKLRLKMCCILLLFNLHKITSQNTKGDNNASDRQVVSFKNSLSISLKIEMSFSSLQ